MHPKYHHEVLAALVDLKGACTMKGKSRQFLSHITLGFSDGLLIQGWGWRLGVLTNLGSEPQSLTIPKSSLSVLIAGTII